MNIREIKNRFFNISTLKAVGVLLVFLLAGLLFWHSNATSYQAEMALTAQVYFDGEYRIADGEWQSIVRGQHISSTKGDVTLRGNFHILAPDGEYVGVYDGGIPIAFYTDHINLTFYEAGVEPVVIDMENPIFGNAACGVGWDAHALSSGEPVEILIHNPHRFGNENAIDEMLDKTAFWADIEFEKGIMESGELQRYIGLLFMMISLLFFGSALFSFLIHINNSKILWVFGIAILFAGAYITFSSDGVSFWNRSVVSNTTILGCSMMLYMLLFCLALVHFLKKAKKAGTVTVILLGLADAFIFVLPIFTDILFYDTMIYWVAVQILANGALLVCLLSELPCASVKKRWVCVVSILPLASFCVDVMMTYLGVWDGGVASTYIFVIFFLLAIAVMLWVIPYSINALAKTRELETEKLVLNAKLSESRVSTMMSQIRPHFIYNTLGSIEQLCRIDPPKAAELVHSFAKYLRGNFGELDNPKPILMSKEMEHVHHYVSIESVRFPDMTFSFEMASDDFHLPALTIQPIVENAIKHGLMKLQKGGTIRVKSYETDTHYCVLVEDDGGGFDTGVLLDERKHVGIRNIRGRLQAMVNGSLEIESTIGVGTRVLISIPKEERK